MTFEEAKQLRPGDKVYWNDPDNSACSRYLTIKTINVYPDEGPVTVVSIMEPDGDVVVCFLKELK